MKAEDWTKNEQGSALGDREDVVKNLPTHGKEKGNSPSSKSMSSGKFVKKKKRRAKTSLCFWDKTNKEIGTGGWELTEEMEESRGQDPEKADTKNKCNLPSVNTSKEIGITENSPVEEEDGIKGEVF